MALRDGEQWLFSWWPLGLKNGDCTVETETGRVVSGPASRFDLVATISRQLCREQFRQWLSRRWRPAVTPVTPR